MSLGWINDYIIMYLFMNAAHIEKTKFNNKFFQNLIQQHCAAQRFHARLQV